MQNFLFYLLTPGCIVGGGGDQKGGRDLDAGFLSFFPAC
jgi:hypothetical protein